MPLLTEHEMRLQKVLKYDEQVYTPSYVKNALSTGSKTEVKALRQEYSRLRSIAEKRLVRLKASEFVESQIVKEFDGRFKTLKEMKAPFDLAYGLSNLRRFLGRKASTVTGQRETRQKAIETFHRHGFTGINEKNYDEMAELISAYRESHVRYNLDNIAYIVQFRKELKAANPDLNKVDLDTALYQFLKEQGDTEEASDYFAMRRRQKRLRAERKKRENAR